MNVDYFWGLPDPPLGFLSFFLSKKEIIVWMENLIQLVLFMGVEALHIFVPLKYNKLTY